MNAPRLLALPIALTLAAALAPTPSPAQLQTSARKPLGAVKAAQAGVRRLAVADTLPCPTRVPNVAGVSFRNLSLVNANFTRRSLVNADFTKAVIDGSLFVAADLRGANFSGARFIGSNAQFPNDFTLANLTNACFKGATFESAVAYTYFSHAVLTGADFSSTNLSSAPIAFGPLPLTFDPAVARPRFRNATMSCEFVAQWKDMDLSSAQGLQACALDLKGADLSGAIFAGVDLSNIDLGATKWTGASLVNVNFQGAILEGATGLNGATDLTQAQFNQASARYLDFRRAKLNGANFTNADLEGTDFGGAVLSDPLIGAATFDGAHLKNVSFAGATLNSASFRNASVYGSAIGVPAQVCQLPPACGADVPRTGGTCSCASMSGANLTRTDFTGAFLYGVDFSGAATIVNGTDFTTAILVAANFSGATFSVDSSQGGAAPRFDGAWLQGAQLPAANLNGSTLNGAFVDFGAKADGNLRTGNALRVALTRDFARFRNWRGSATPCVKLRYDLPSLLPTAIGTMTCPDGRVRAAGCGALLPRDPNVASNPAWNGGSVVGNSPVPGWYQLDSTYDTAAPPANWCNGNPDDPLWFPANPPK